MHEKNTLSYVKLSNKPKRIRLKENKTPTTLWSATLFNVNTHTYQKR